VNYEKIQWIDNSCITWCRLCFYSRWIS